MTENNTPTTTNPTAGAEIAVEAQVTPAATPTEQNAPAKPAKPSLSAELNAARSENRIVNATVIDLVEKTEDGGKKRVVGAHVELEGFRFGKHSRLPFLPKGHFGFPWKNVVKGAKIQVCILPEDKAKPGVVVSRKLAIDVFLKTLEANKSVVKGTVCGVNPKGNYFVAIDNGFEALLLGRYVREGVTLETGEQVEALVIVVDLTKELPSVILKLTGDKAASDNQGRSQGGNRGQQSGGGDQGQRSGGGQSQGSGGDQGQRSGGGQSQGRSNDRGRGYRKDGDRGERGERSEKGRRKDGDRRASGGGFGGRSRWTSGSDERQPSDWGIRHGLRSGGFTEGKIVSFSGLGFTVQISKHVQASLAKSEVSDTAMSDEALQALVGTTQKLVVVSVDDDNESVSVSLKRVYPGSIGWRQPMTGVCTEVRPNGDRIITVGNESFKANGKLPMHYTTHEKVRSVELGSEVTIELDSVINARELIFKLQG